MIFCIEDDSSIRDLMIYTLSASGFQAKGFSNASSLFQILQTETPQLILLDLMLPDEDGISILKKLKSNMKTSDIPVIIASAKGINPAAVSLLDTASHIDVSSGGKAASQNLPPGNLSSVPVCPRSAITRHFYRLQLMPCTEARRSGLQN